jgi:hypothetical protein
MEAGGLVDSDFNDHQSQWPTLVHPGRVSISSTLGSRPIPNWIVPIRSAGGKI